MEYIQLLANLLVAKLPILAGVGANAMAICLAAGLLIEAVEVVAALTPTAKDDAAAAKAKAIKDKAIAILELFPHANIPVAPAVVKVCAVVAKVVKGLIAAVQAVRD